MIHPWGVEHIIYLIICAIILIPLAIFLKYKLKNEKQIEIMFNIIGLIGLIVIIMNRLSISIAHDNYFKLIPSSFCGMSSLLMAISLLFFKKDNNILHAIWLIGFLGMIITLAYPDFVEEGNSIFYLPTLTSFLHHTITLYALIFIFLFKYVNLRISKAWTQLVFGAIYIGTGFFLIYVGKVKDAFYIYSPALKDTILYFALLLPFYILLYSLIIGTIELIRYKKKKTESA